MPHAIIHGDCRQSFSLIGDNEVGLGLCDPPYEIAIAGNGWDSSGVAYDPAVWRGYYRVLRPGAHLLVFGATRTIHRVACAIEDVGFEIRDQLQWLYASGMPHGRAIDKAIDELLGAQRPVIRRRTLTAGGGESFGFQKGAKRQVQADITAPGSPQAAVWEGWNTTLRPAHEPIILARKPLREKSVERNVLQWGAGAMNVRAGKYGANLWPTNVIVSHAPGCGMQCVPGCPAAMLDAQHPGSSVHFKQLPHEEYDPDLFCHKPEREEKDQGCWHLPRRAPDASSTMAASPQARERNAAIERGEAEGMLNFHPTVKPVNLMQYLCGIFGVPGLPVLDAFTGSGTTGVAAVSLGFEFVGFELTADYLPIIEGRLAHAEAMRAAQWRAA